MNKFSDTMEAY